MNISQKMPETAQNHLESVCIDIRSCPQSLGRLGFLKLQLLGCIHDDQRFLETKLGHIGAVIWACKYVS